MSALREQWKIIQRRLGFENPKGRPGPLTVKKLKEALGIEEAPPSLPEGLPSLPWMEEARKWIGIREIPGPRHHAQILKWWGLIRTPFRDDETPWCAGFVGGVLEAVGIRSSRSAAARSFEKWGESAGREPVYGSIVVFWRGKPSGWTGHVAFVVGKTADGSLLCLGGNQSNAVTVAKFSASRVLGYRFPSGDHKRVPAPIMKGPADFSTNEA